MEGGHLGRSERYIIAAMAAGGKRVSWE